MPCIIMSPVPVTNLLCPVFFVKVRNKSITNGLLMVSQSINTISHINKKCLDIMIYACSIVCILVMRIDDILDNAASTITILPIEKRLSLINFYMRQHRNYRSILLFTSICLETKFTKIIYVYIECAVWVVPDLNIDKRRIGLTMDSIFVNAEEPLIYSA